MRGLGENSCAALLVTGLASAGFAFTVHVFYPGVRTLHSLVYNHLSANRSRLSACVHGCRIRRRPLLDPTRSACADIGYLAAGIRARRRNLARDFVRHFVVACRLVFATLDRGWKVRASMQISLFALLAFGVLPGPNALAAAPVLFAYTVWPSQFSFRRAALFYVPAALGMLASRK